MLGFSLRCALLSMSRAAMDGLLVGKTFKQFCDARGWDAIKCKGGFPRGSLLSVASVRAAPDVSEQNLS